MFKSALTVTAVLASMINLVKAATDYERIAQEGLTLTVGRLSYSSGAVNAVKQQVSVTNNTQNLIPEVWVECGFFNNGELIGTGRQYLENIAPGATAFKTIVEISNSSADHAECRIESVNK